MNFLAIYNEIADELDDDRQSTIYNADLSTLSQTIRRRRNNINLAYNMVLLALNRINESRETSTTFTTVVNQENYDFPAGILNLDQLQVNTDPPIGIIPWPNYERYKRDTLLITVTGTPTMAAIYKRQIWLYPTPDAAYTVNVRGQETLTELSQDTDSPDLPADYHRAIRELALAYEMDYENNPRANNQMQRAQQTIEAVRLNSRDHYSEPPRMIGIAEKRRTNAIRRIVKT